MGGGTTARNYCRTRIETTFIISTPKVFRADVASKSNSELMNVLEADGHLDRIAAVGCGDAARSESPAGRDRVDRIVRRTVAGRAAGRNKVVSEKVGRNDLCPCGSGKRFKKCCRNSGCFRRREPGSLLSGTENMARPIRVWWVFSRLLILRVGFWFVPVAVAHRLTWILRESRIGDRQSAE